jgi:hypothetical protein
MLRQRQEKLNVGAAGPGVEGVISAAHLPTLAVHLCLGCKCKQGACGPLVLAQSASKYSLGLQARSSHLLRKHKQPLGCSWSQS